MTREEAIFYIKELQKTYASMDKKVAEAIDMAIEALTEPINCVNCKHYYETEDDTDVHGHCRIDTVTLNSPISIQAEMVSVVRCKDCRYCTEYYDRDGYPYWECAEWDSGTDADGFCHYGERRKNWWIGE